MKVRRRKKSGEVFWASVSLSVAHDESGVPNGLIGYVVDISGEQDAEEKLRLHARIFDCAGEAVVVTDADERIVSANPAFYEISGFPSTKSSARRRQPCNSVPRTAAGRRFGIRSPARGNGRGDAADPQDGTAYPHGPPSLRSKPQRCCLPLLFHLLRHIGTQGSGSADLPACLLRHADQPAQPGAALFPARAGTDGGPPAAQPWRHPVHRPEPLQAHQRLVLATPRPTCCWPKSVVGFAAALRKEDVVSRLGGDEFVIALFDINLRDDAAIVAQGACRPRRALLHPKATRCCCRPASASASSPRTGAMPRP